MDKRHSLIPVKKCAGCGLDHEAHTTIDADGEWYICKKLRVAVTRLFTTEIVSGGGIKGSSPAEERAVRAVEIAKRMVQLLDLNRIDQMAQLKVKDPAMHALVYHEVSGLRRGIVS